MSTSYQDAFTDWPSEDRKRYRDAGLWRGETLGDALHRWADQYGSRVAVRDHKSALTFRELDERATRMAGGFQKRGITRGDRVLVQMPNTNAFVVVAFALFRLGAFPVFALPAQRLKDLDALTKNAAPVAYICQATYLGFDYREMANELAAANACLRHVIVDGDNAAHIALASVDGPFDTSNPPLPHDIACLLLSGGTTGTPKLIPRTHDDYALNARLAAQICMVGQDDVYMAALPAAHNFSLSCPGIIGTLSVGGRVVLARTAAVDEAFVLIAQEKVTITALVPALVPLWLQQKEWDDADLSSLRLMQVGGARLPADLANSVSTVIDTRVQQVFGMAEGLICMTSPTDIAEVIANTQGRPICDDDDVRIVDGDGNDVPDGAVGELLVKGPYTIRGYYNAAVQNRTAFGAGGYYRSGDLVRRRADGNLVVEGRAKEQINRAGEKISAAEIEDLLRQHPAVRDVVYIAVPDVALGERNCAVVIAEGKEPSLSELRAYLRDLGVAQFKHPDELRFARDWPLTPIGKIDRRRLAEMTERPAMTERAVAFAGDPLAVAAALAIDPDHETIVYERDGEWSVAVGVVAEITVNGTVARLVYKGNVREWPAKDPMKALQNAMDAVTVDGWRAYGTAEFELSRRLHGLSLMDDKRTLVRLVIPRMEYRLRDGAATLRAFVADDLNVMASQVANAVPFVPSTAVAMPDLMPGAETYKAAVSRAVREITKGDYQKIILSRRVTLDFGIDMAATYVTGRRANQPARSFLILNSGLQAAGFSPETVVEVSADGMVATQPLAGTRATTEDEAWNAALANDLVTDPKEIAEHAVSVKLAHEELAAICDAGTILVPDYMTIVRRGSVQHLASRLQGRLRAGMGRWHALATLFPAVTASGIDKRNAIDAIGRHEPTPRHLYSGAVMIADQDGSLDAALVLRTIYQQNGQAWLHAGAGIVSLSTPERELTETCEKMGSIARNLVSAALPNVSKITEITDRV